MSRDVYSTRTDREDGLDLRSIGFAGQPVVARIYFAARDPLWRTVPMRILATERQRTDDGFDLRVTAESLFAEMPLTATLGYRAKGDELVAEVVAVAGGGFRYNRIGFCVLLDVGGYRGRRATTRRGEGVSWFDFPEEIVTRNQTDENTVRFHQPFDELVTELAGDTRVAFSFEGVGFEFEDQRSWADPSYKAYSISPEPWPMSAHEGQRFEQRVRIRVTPGSAPAAAAAAPEVTLGNVVGTLPAVDVFRGRVVPGSFRPGGGFQELNAGRRSDVPNHGAIELAVNGAVHAADTDSVFDTVAMHGEIVRQARALFPGVPVHLAPVSFLDDAGDWRDPTGEYNPEPPPGATPERWGEPLAAAWVVASVAVAAPAGAASLHYFSPALPVGCPAAEAIARLRRLAGRDLLAVSVPSPLVGVAVADGEALVLALANRGPDPQPVRLPNGREVMLGPFGAEWFEFAYANRAS